MTNKFWQETVPQDALVTGDHKSEVVPFKAREFRSEDKGLQRFVDAVKELLSRVMGNKPDYDTGYQYVENDTDYDIKHNLGFYPSRVACYFSSVAEPKESVDVIHHVVPVSTRDGAADQWYGFRLRSLSKKKMRLETEADYILYTSVAAERATTGYMRIQLWR